MYGSVGEREIDGRTDCLDKFRELFAPQASFIVGDGGISVEEFLSMDIIKLFQSPQ